jgi:hypothetical protein
MPCELSGNSVDSDNTPKVIGASAIMPPPRKAAGAVSQGSSRSRRAGLRGHARPPLRDGLRHLRDYRGSVGLVGLASRDVARTAPKVRGHRTVGQKIGPERGSPVSGLTQTRLDATLSHADAVNAAALDALRSGATVHVEHACVSVCPIDI